LDLKAAEQLTDVSSLYTSSGVPQALITLGATSQIWPFTNGANTFAGLYFASIPQLTSVVTTNWVITKYPTAYLYGCLAAAAGLVQDVQPAQAARFDTWRRMFSRAIDRIQREDAKDLDARSNVTLDANTSLFSGGSSYNVIADA
jgi:hypothetical protein